VRNSGNSYRIVFVPVRRDRARAFSDARQIAGNTLEVSGKTIKV